MWSPQDLRCLPHAPVPLHLHRIRYNARFESAFDNAAPFLFPMLRSTVMRPLTTLGLLAFSICEVCCAQPLIPEGGITVRIDEILIDKFPEILARLTILDPSGRAIRKLERRDMVLVEDEAFLKLDRFELDSTPISVVVALDLSGSMVEALGDVKTAAARYFRILEDYDEAALLVFADKPRLLSDFTTRHESLITSLWPLRAYGPTALYDSIHFAALRLKGRPGRRVLILLTDGQDQNQDGTARQSLRSLSEALKTADDADVIRYVIGLGPRINQDELKQIAGELGGVYYTSRSQDLEEMYVKIARNLKNRMEVSYVTPNVLVDGTWRTLEVRVSSRGFFGAGSALYLAPGRYVIEIPGHGYNRLDPDALKGQKLLLNLRDVKLKAILSGSGEDLSQWLDQYYKKP